MTAAALACVLCTGCKDALDPAEHAERTLAETLRRAQWGEEAAFDPFRAGLHVHRENAGPLPEARRVIYGHAIAHALRFVKDPHELMDGVLLLDSLEATGAVPTIVAVSEAHEAQLRNLGTQVMGDPGRYIDYLPETEQILERLSGVAFPDEKGHPDFDKWRAWLESRRPKSR